MYNREIRMERARRFDKTDALGHLSQWEIGTFEKTAYYESGYTCAAMASGHRRGHIHCAYFKE